MTDTEGSFTNTKHYITGSWCIWQVLRKVKVQETNWKKQKRPMRGGLNEIFELLYCFKCSSQNNNNKKSVSLA